MKLGFSSSVDRIWAQLCQQRSDDVHQWIERLLPLLAEVARQNNYHEDPVLLSMNGITDIRFEQDQFCMAVFMHEQEVIGVLSRPEKIYPIRDPQIFIDRFEAFVKSVDGRTPESSVPIPATTDDESPRPVE